MYKSNSAAYIVKGARFMPCTLIDENSGKTYEINVKEPKLKVYKKFEAIGEETSVEEIIEVAALVLNSNKEGIKIDAEFVEDNFTLDEIAQFFEDFTNWLSDARKTNPN
ncbi:MAG: hypothetical protein U0L88_00245 [Acutalibacteraceae bacterium]|nr:hypothetical protein [Acutalibacteraceae bacterium]